MSAQAFDESEHPRGDHGRFTSGSAGAAVAMAHPLRMQAHALQRQRQANSHDTKVVQLFRGAPKPVPSDAPAADAPMNGEGRPVFSERRSLARSSSAWSIGAKTKELPIGYTGNRQPELPVGSYKRGSFQEQVPAAMSVQDHQALFHNLKNTIQLLREPIAAAAHEPKKRGKLRGSVLIPEGTSKATINRAYNLASIRALHAFGVGKLDYAMDDHLKAELTPLTNFIRYAERRVLTTMLATQKGAYRPYRQEFGRPFADNRRDKITGEVRLRVPSQGELIKAVLFDGYTGLEKGFGLPAGPNPNVIPAAQGAAGSRFDRYRKAIAMAEGQGHHSNTPLTAGQLQERRKAGVDYRKKLLSGATPLKAGQPGSIAGLHIPKPTSSVNPHDPGITGVSTPAARPMRIGAGVTLSAPKPAA